MNPGAQYPHGALRLGPDTTNALIDVGYRHFSGYNYLDTKIRMFSHTHFVGAGINGLGNLGVMPVRLHDKNEEELPLQEWVYQAVDSESKDDNATFNTLAWWSTFDKESEYATPGTYDVHLDTPDVTTSLLATGTLTAMHEYKFLPKSQGRESMEKQHYFPAIVVDVCHAAQLSSGITRFRNSNCHNASFAISSDGQSFTASLLADKDIWLYFYGKFTSPAGSMVTAKSWNVCSNANNEDGGAEFTCDKTALTGASDNGILFSRVSFGPVDSQDTSRIELRVGMSLISTDMAEKNFLVDFPDVSSDDFQSRLETTANKWCSTLDYMKVTPIDGDLDIERMLYSANYRAHMTPTIYTEAGGVYLGLDKLVHNATQERMEIYGSDIGSTKVMEFYSDLSLWDTFRGAHPWLLLTDESLAVGVLRSMSEMTQQQNAFPKWVLANNDISCMVGLHGGNFCGINYMTCVTCVYAILFLLHFITQAPLRLRLR